MFIVLAQTQRTRVQRLSPKNKGVSPYIPLQAGYRSKKQSSTHIWLHVTSLALSFSLVLCDLHVSILFISLLCHTLPLTCQNTSLYVSFLASPFLLQYEQMSYQLLEIKMRLGLVQA
jgi:hypothetical protein